MHNQKWLKQKPLPAFTYEHYVTPDDYFIIKKCWANKIICKSGEGDPPRPITQCLICNINFPNYIL